MDATKTKTKTKDSTTKSTTKIIKNFHSMPWLKRSPPFSKNSKTPRICGKDGKILSKKTNEDYFPGTKEEKKPKKKKDKKVQPVLTMDTLEDFINSKSPPVVVADLIELPRPKPTPPETTECPVLTLTNSETAPSTIWSATSGVVDKLFPNVQSVVIDRLEEEEMLTRAIAESIATVQLEQFNRPSPEKENRWEALYGDDEDESGWDNVRRNLPDEPETINSAEEISTEKKTFDNNNNSSKPGILRNKNKALLSDISKEIEKLDFCFKTTLEISGDETESPRSQKSVSFNESIVAKVPSAESSDNDDSENASKCNAREPHIDKFGRVDGYSERRLFMGKGARMKEQEYIQNKFNNQKLEPNSNASEVEIETRKLPSISLHPQQESSQIEKSVDKVAEIKTEENAAPRNLDGIKKEIKIGAQKLAATSSHTQVENSQTQKPVDKVVEMKTEGNHAPRNSDRMKTEEYIKGGSRNIDLKSESQRLSQKPASFSQRPQNSHTYKPATKFEKMGTRNAVEVKSFNKQTPRSEKNMNHVSKNGWKLEESVAKSPLDKSTPKALTKSLPKKDENRKELVEVKRNVEIIPNTTHKSSYQTRSKPEPIISCNTQTIDSQNENKLKTDFGVKIQIQDLISHDSTIKENVAGRCLVPMLVRDDDWTSKVSKSDFLCESPTAKTPSIEFQSAAYRNLLLTGMTFEDLDCDFANFLHENYATDNSTPLNASSESETLDEISQIRNEFINTPNQVYENNQMNQLPNYNTYAMIPNFSHPANALQRLQNMPLEYLEFIQQIGGENLPCQSVNLNWNETDFIMRDRHSLLSENNQVLGSGIECNNLPPCVSTNTTPNQYSSIRTPPGLIKNSQLPPGFTRQEHGQRNNTPVVNRSMKYTEQRQENIQDEAYRNNYRQSASGLHQENQKSPMDQKRSFYRPEVTADEPQTSETLKSRRMPYPILGASQKANELQNWQCNANFINRTQVPTNFVPNYEMLAYQNAQNSAANFFSAFQSSTHQIQGSQQMTSAMINPAHNPSYSMQQHHQNLKVDNFASGGMTPVPQSMVGDRSCGSYSFEQTVPAQFMGIPSGISNPTENQADKDIRSTCNLNNLIRNDYAQFLSKGRGRLMRTDLL